MGPMKMTVLMLLGAAGFVDAVLMFAQPPWFNVFIGSLIPVVLPFAGAMTAIFGMRSNV